MHRNTTLLVLVLTVTASLLVGINIGRNLSSPPRPETQSSTAQTLSPPPSPPLPSAAKEELALREYHNAYCGISFRYPTTLTEVDGATASAVLINQEKPEESVVVTCQKDIPRPALPPERIESATISGVVARLYHDTSAKDGTPLDTLIFRHPNTGLDVFLAGSGPAFQQILSSLKIL